MSLSDDIHLGSLRTRVLSALPVYFYLRGTAVFNASLNVSCLSLLFVAVYRFITIRVDPFGRRNIVTTPRCVATCLSAWLLNTPHVIFTDEVVIAYVASTSIILVMFSTGLAYALIYLDISRAANHGSATDRRKMDENKRLLRTFAFMYITSILVWVWTGTYYIIATSKFAPEWLLQASEWTININLVLNPSIFVWRSREFRAMIKSWIRGRKTGVVAVVA
ncbi:uncharacterized protein [Diadema setosum]|uniref:uncharacterized protein n=1 Tax=Diadema setosum TaxID=31175 RepID=UPI003B3A5F37